jgi:tetratricopeptide (TPR) repeat protein
MVSIMREPWADVSLPPADVSGDRNEPRQYTIRQCIRNFGAARYLWCLRARRDAGAYSDEEFVVLAARAYLDNGHPRRALALLCGHPSPAAAHAVLAAEAQRSALSIPCPCTLNMIVKNEEATLGRALGSVDDIVDEIVVCDTGSSDATVEIALRYGATVVREPWRNDFSAPRNAALAASTGSWIFWLDADDVLDPASKDGILSLVRAGGPHAALVCVDNVHHGAPGMQFLQVRLFPRLQGIAFERRVHEQISPSLHRLGVAHKYYPAIRIVHAGYDDPDIHKRKALRNKPLIIEELRANPDSAALLLSLGDCLSVLGETNEALDAYNTIISNPLAQARDPDMYVQAVFDTALLYRDRGDVGEACRWLGKAIALDPSRSEAFYMLGLIAQERGEREKAFGYFLSCSRIKPPVRKTATDALKIRIDSSLRVAGFLFSRGMFDECESIARAALESYPNVVDFHTLLGKVLLCANDLPQAARHFMTSLTLAPGKNPDAARGMAVVYLLLKDRKKARNFLERAGDAEVRSQELCATRVTVRTAPKKGIAELSPA